MALALPWVFCTDIRTDSDFALYTINWLVFITVVESVYCAVRTDSLYKADYVSSLKGQLSSVSWGRMQEWRYTFIHTLLLLASDLFQLSFLHTVRLIAGVGTHWSFGSEYWSDQYFSVFNSRWKVRNLFGIEIWFLGFKSKLYLTLIAEAQRQIIRLDAFWRFKITLIRN